MSAPVSAEVIEKAHAAVDNALVLDDGTPGFARKIATDVITAVRDDLVAEALAPIRALAEEWYADTYLYTASPADMLADLQRLLAPVQAAEPFPEFVACAECWSTVETCEGTDGGCCEACRATAGCTHSPSPVQAAEEVGGRGE